jgi:hypothetical protein
MWVTVIVGWILAGASGIRSLAQAVANAIQAFWNNLVAIFAAWVKAFQHLGAGAGWAWSSFTVLMLSIPNAVIWLLIVKIPGALQEAKNYAVTLGASIINQLVAYAETRLAWLYNLAQLWVNSLRSYVDTWLGWVRSKFVDVINLLNDVAKRVYALLTSPRVLADWVAGEIIAAVFRWALGNAEALARWAFARLLAATMAGASLAEHIIVDMFM